MTGVVVIGAGLSGLAAACALAKRGVPVRLVAEGLGGMALSQGTVDLWGHDPAPVARPLERIAAAPQGHPYRAIGAHNVRSGVELLLDLLGEGFLEGDIETNTLLPTALGALRPTALYPPSMAAGAPSDGARWALVGFDRVRDFYPRLAAGNLNRTQLPGGGFVHASAHMLDLPDHPLLGGADASAMTVARVFDQPGYAQMVARAIAPLVKGHDAVGLPAVLGATGRDAWATLTRELGKPVFEVSLPPPSLPGHRLGQALTSRARELGVRVALGARVTRFTAEAGRVIAVHAAAAGAPRPYRADEFVYCPGGFESGALTMDSRHGIVERLFGLPLTGLAPVDELITADYGARQKVFEVGVRVDDEMRPVDPAGEPVYANLRVAGSLLGGAIRWAEKSGEGLALGSAWAAVEAIGRSAA